MKIVKRYYSEGRLVEAPNGPVVMFEDFQALEREDQSGVNKRNAYEAELAKELAKKTEEK